MLIQFAVENYLSIDNEQVFSLLATSDNQHLPHLVSDIPRKGENCLRAAALYGANGAGKSSLVKAIKFAQDLILEGTRGSQAIPIRPFKLGKERGRPSKFEFIFQTSGVVYQYGFRADAVRVIEEWLFATEKSRETLLFQRATSENGKVDIELGPAFTGRSVKNKQFLEFVGQGTRPNQLFLTEAVERNVSAVAPVWKWFDDDLVVIPAEARATSLEVNIRASEPHADFLAAFLKAAGTGIERIVIEEVPFDFDIAAPHISQAERDAILEDVTHLEGMTTLALTGWDGRRYILVKGDEGQPVQLRLTMRHLTADGRFETLSMDEESDGTQRLIHLLPALYMLKQPSQKVVVLDELDRRFHTLLSRFFIETALNGAEEHQRSQLIFTTHDTNLLDLNLLRRDEIWFVEKDAGGASHFYSLAEFRVRPDLKIEKGYLNGRFGAIPFAASLESLGWTPQRTEAIDETREQAQRAA